MSKLRVAYYTDDGTLAVAPAVRRAVREAADILRDCGAQITAWSPPDVPQAIEAFFSIFTADGGELVSEMLGRGYTALYNLLGYPAGIVPNTRVRPGEESDRAASRDILEQAARKVELGSAGLPVGVQVVARPWREHVALAAMQAIEHAARARADFPAAPQF